MGKKAGGPKPAAPPPPAPTGPTWLTPISDTSCRIAVHAKPNAKVCSIVSGEAALDVAIDAPAREGEANDGIVEFVAEALGLKRRGVALVAGHKSRDKVLRVDGLSATQVLERVQKYAGEGGG